MGSPFSDPFYSSTKLLMPFAQPLKNRDHVNYSPAFIVFTRDINAGEYKAENARGYRSCYYFDKNTRFSAAGAGLPATGDFTVEFWTRSVDVSQECCLVGFDVSTGRYQFGIIGGQMQFWFGGTPNRWVVTGPAVFNQAPHHAAFCRDSGGLRFYADGELVHTEPITQSFRTDTPKIGNYGTSDQARFGYKGWVNDLRITHAARYTANFTPPGPLIPEGMLGRGDIEQWFLGAKYTIGNNATKFAGGPVDAVMLFEWGTWAPLWSITPDEAGYWEAEVIEGTYGVLYIAEGCEPVAHGPYSVGPGP